MTWKCRIPDFGSWRALKDNRKYVEGVPDSVNPDHKVYEKESYALPVGDKYMQILQEDCTLNNEYERRICDFDSVSKLCV